MDKPLQDCHFRRVSKPDLNGVVSSSSIGGPIDSLMVHGTVYVIAN